MLLAFITPPRGKERIMCFALNFFASNCSSTNFRALRVRMGINNLLIPTDCTACKKSFVPSVGLHPLLNTNGLPVCPSCAEGAVDVTSPAACEKNEIDLVRFEALYRAPQYRKAA